VGISKFKKGFLPRTKVVMDEKGDLVTDCRSTRHFGQVEEPFLLAVQCTQVNDVRPRKIHTAEPRVPELSASDFKMAIEKLKRL